MLSVLKQESRVLLRHLIVIVFTHVGRVEHETKESMLDISKRYTVSTYSNITIITTFYKTYKNHLGRF